MAGILCSKFENIYHITNYTVQYQTCVKELNITGTVIALKFRNIFLVLFSNKMLVIKAGNHKMLVRIAKREGPDQKKQFDLGLPCLSRPFWQATSVRNFRTYAIMPIIQSLKYKTCVKELNIPGTVKYKFF